MATEQKRITQAEVMRYRALKQECSQIQTKIGELQIELNEHELVIKTLNDLDGGRKSFHLVGGVLVEQTVAEVLPQVNANKDGIVNLLSQMEEMLKTKGAEAATMEQTYGISDRPPQRRGQGQQQRGNQEQKSQESKSAAGVLA
ncbi:unnamed protein product [Heterosigma akashiwo]